MCFPANGCRLGLALLMVWAVQSWAANVTWDGEVNTGSVLDYDWHKKDNWATDTLPGPGDRVILQAPIPDPYTHLYLQTIDIGSIECSYPIRIDALLRMTGASEFEGCISDESNGAISSSANVVFKGFNDVSFVGFFGAGTFDNQGTLVLETDTASAPFVNHGPCVVQSNGVVQLEDFVNNNVFVITDTARLNSSSDTENNGTLVVGGPGISPATLEGKFQQLGGVINVPANGRGVIASGDQSYKGGTISVDAGAELLLTHITGGLVTREFNGIATIGGSGNVVQSAPFDVKQDLSLSVAAPGSYQPDDLNIETNVTLTNNGVFEMLSSGAKLLGNGAFENTETWKTVSNPLIDVRASNSGVWNCESWSMGTKTVRNRAFMNLSGSNQRIGNVNATPGTLLNSTGTITLDVGSAINPLFRIDVPFQQKASALTTLTKGTLQFFSTWPAVLGGTYRASTNAEFNLYSPTMQSPSDVGSEEVLFEGEGIVNFGVSAGATHYGVQAGDTVRSKVASFKHARGDFVLSEQAKVRIDSGSYFWRGGSFHSDEATGLGSRQVFNSSKNFSIENGSTKQLGVQFQNYPDGLVSQISSISLLTDAHVDGAGRIRNFGTWEITSNCSITGRVQTNTGPSDVSFSNELLGRLLCKGAINASVSVDFLNESYVVVLQGATLNMPNVLNLSPDGTLSNGVWTVSEGATLNLAHPVTSLRHGATWNGGNGASITNVGSSSFEEKASALTVSGALEGTQGLNIQGKSTVTIYGTGKLKNTIVAFFDSSTMEGEGLVEGLVKMGNSVGSGDGAPSKIRPGESPGVLTIDGDLEFGVAEYEWEANGAGTNQIDLLVVSNTVSLAGGIVPNFIDGYVPPIGTTFTALVAGVVSGSFDYVRLGEVPPGMGVTVGYSANSVTLTTVATNYNTFADWRAARFSPSDQTNVLVSGEAADPEGDGLQNLAEYAHGYAPGSMDSGAVTVDDGVAGSTDLIFPWVDGLTDVSYSVVASSSIDGVYNPVAHSVVSAISDGTVSEVTLRVTQPAMATRQYYQLRIEQGP